MQATDGQTERTVPPPTGSKLGYWLRRLRMWVLVTFRYRFLHVGRRFYMGYRCTVFPRCVSVGDYCFVGSRCHFAAQVRMGNLVMIASCVSMVGGDHRFRVVGAPSIWTGSAGQRPIIIEDDVWIGHGATIMHGVRLGEGAIIAAGALVTHDVPPYAIVGAKPATVIGQRFEGEDRDRHSRRLRELKEDLGLGEVEDRL